MKRFVLMLALVALATSPLAAQWNPNRSVFKNWTEIEYRANDPIYGKSIWRSWYDGYSQYRYPALQQDRYRVRAYLYAIENAEGVHYLLRYHTSHYEIRDNLSSVNLMLVLDDTTYRLPARVEKTVDHNGRLLSFDFYATLSEETMQKIVGVTKYFGVYPEINGVRLNNNHHAITYRTKKAISSLHNDLRNIMEPRDKKVKKKNITGTPFTF
ncbi:hypothetical protein [Entomospira culicis]|uniref:Uncharacterized protein n=1 Tax=Entomospira culicis TaxID=2719989 RepID=A0A968GGR4_9SPIO|nr:hypothetical protein [Entomospira culicis]NIZ19803.1 hypothetical protein [Entomospira culicis]NIZ70017.1 hypothetical protein [Entomospira culicis]WDI37122.1 hypothetical protein PVA46_07325 [Entomospira culicis]WDI38751.1 hypothetical protein PVA47_07335 [Entomospira culicis]